MFSPPQLMIARSRIAIVMLFATGCAHAAPSHGREVESAVDVVVRLYKDFAWETLIDEPRDSGAGLPDQPRSVLMQYFDDSLTTLFLRDADCRARTRGVCNLDFMPLWAGQDISARNLRITPGSDPAVVIVEFQRAPETEPTRLTYHLAMTARGWRVRDIRSSGWSLLSLLSGH